jgi:hypothetical protein
MDKEAFLETLRDLDADLAYLVGTLAGARIEDRARSVIERLRTNALTFAEVLRTTSWPFPKSA